MEKKKWDNPIWNILLIAGGATLAFVIGAQATLTGAGMAAIILYWFPIILGIVGILIYLLSRLFFKKYNWIISLLFVLFMITYSIRMHFAEIG